MCFDHMLQISISGPWPLNTVHIIVKFTDKPTQPQHNREGEDEHKKYKN